MVGQGDHVSKYSKEGVKLRQGKRFMLHPKGTFENSSGKAISKSAKVIKQANTYYKAHIS